VDPEERQEGLGLEPRTKSSGSGCPPKPPMSERSRDSRQAQVHHDAQGLPQGPPVAFAVAGPCRRSAPARPSGTGQDPRPPVRSQAPHGLVGSPVLQEAVEVVGLQVVAAASFHRVAHRKRQRAGSQAAKAAGSFMSCQTPATPWSSSAGRSRPTTGGSPVREVRDDAGPGQTSARAGRPSGSVQKAPRAIPNRTRGIPARPSRGVQDGTTGPPRFPGPGRGLQVREPIRSTVKTRCPCM
jgi:hypothetical protein